MTVGMSVMFPPPDRSSIRRPCYSQSFQFNSEDFQKIFRRFSEDFQKIFKFPMRTAIVDPLSSGGA
eukprot:1176911-Prorocentrum_minimum.AAC.4